MPVVEHLSDNQARVSQNYESQRDKRTPISRGYT